MREYVQANGAGVIDDLAFELRDIEPRLVIERLKRRWKGRGGLASVLSLLDGPVGPDDRMDD